MVIAKKRAAELVIANKELDFQDEEKGKREAELIIANTELIFQNKEIERRVKDETKKDELFNIVSHEFKTPLTSIKVINQLLERIVNKTDKTFPLILKANQSIKRLERLVDDLTDVTKINSGKIDLSIKKFEFADALIQSISSVQQISGKHKIILENSIDILYDGDQFLIERVVINLLNNAIKYSPAANLIIVKSYVESGHITVSVKDFGIGVAKEDIDQLFKRFFRVNKTVMLYQGVGLGLYIASEIIERHHGIFKIESEPDKGSTFTFSLPLESKVI